jgi:hypothetical protein
LGWEKIWRFLSCYFEKKQKRLKLPEVVRKFIKLIRKFINFLTPNQTCAAKHFWMHGWFLIEEVILEKFIKKINEDNKILELHANFELDRSLYSCTKAQNMHVRLISHIRSDLRQTS